MDTRRKPVQQSGFHKFDSEPFKFSVCRSESYVDAWSLSPGKLSRRPFIGIFLFVSTSLEATEFPPLPVEELSGRTDKYERYTSK